MSVRNIFQKICMLIPSYRQRNALLRSSVQTQEMVLQILLLMKKTAILKDDILNFIYNDENIKFYLPYAGIDFTQTEILNKCNFYEIEMLAYCRSIIKPGFVIVDAGANVGNHTVYFAKICNAESVYSFEPQRMVFSILEKNVALNGLKNTYVYNMALGEIDGVAQIKDTPPSCLGETRFAFNSDGSFKVTTIDALGKKVDFLKIDVEGAQLAVLKGARQTLEKYHPVIWVEMNESSFSFARDYDENLEVKQPHDFLVSMGYKLDKKLSPNDFIYVYCC